MPIKFNKETSSKLFRYVRQVDISFNPFDRRTRSARELLRQMQSSRLKKANPKFTVNILAHNKPDAPSAKFVFVDDSEYAFQTKDNHANEMIFQIHLKAMQLDAEYEIAGKNIDDLS